MTMIRSTSIAALLALALLTSHALSQYKLSGWSHRIDDGKKIHYQEMKWAGKGKHNSHMISYYPWKGKYYYYRSWDGKKGRYWGRYDVENDCYQMLAEKDRKEDLADVLKENKFQKAQSVKDIKVPDTKLPLPKPPPLPADEAD